MPLVGPFAMRVLRGGDEVTGATLSRFYGFHVAVLPAVTTLLIGLHVLLVQRQGMSVPIDVETAERAGAPPRSRPFFPDFFLRDLVLWYVAIAIIAALAAFLPWELGKKADPFAPVPPGIRPEWYFVAMFHTLKLIPGHVLGIEGEVLGILGFGVVALVLIAIPFLDRRALRGERNPVFTAMAWLGIAYLVVFTIVGYLAE